MRFPPVILFVLLFLSSVNNGFCQTDCEMHTSTEGIFIYTCKTNDSHFKSIKAVFNIKTKPSVLAGHLLDVVNYSKWQYKLTISEKLEQISNNEVIYRAQYDAPWPVSDRDLVARIKITQDQQTKIMIFEIVNMHDFFPEDDDFVRVKKSLAKWIVTPVGNNEVHVEYTFVVDPGGSIPAWVINLTITEGPFLTFKTLISRIESGVAVATADFIVD